MMKPIIENLKSSISKICAYLVFATFVASCDYKEEQSITFHDEVLEGEVVTGLEDEGIEFRKKGSSIWFSAEYAEEVDKIFIKALTSSQV